MRGMSLLLGYVEFAVSKKYLGDMTTKQEKHSPGTVEAGYQCIWGSLVYRQLLKAGSGGTQWRKNM